MLSLQERYKNIKLREANTHALHIEDSLLLGQDYIKRMLGFFNHALEIVEGTADSSQPRPTVKWDGAPAITMWTRTADLNAPGISTKSLFNVNPKVYYSNEDINNDSRAEGLKEKMKAALKLAQEEIIPPGEIWQGDMLWTHGDYKTFEAEGVKYVYVQPNTLAYAAPADTNLAARIATTEIGIVFHTRYRGSLKSPQQSNDVRIDELQNVPDWAFVIDARLPDLSGKVTLDKNASEGLFNGIEELKNICNRLINHDEYENLVSNEEFIQFYMMTLQNHKVDKGEEIETSTFIEELHDWITKKMHKAYSGLDKLKTVKGRDNKRDSISSTSKELHFIVENNKDLIQEIARGLQFATHIKGILIDQFNKSQEWITRVNTRSGGMKVTNGEGFVISDNDGKFVKMVDRSAFSYFNRSPDVVKGFERITESEEIEEIILTFETEEEAELALEEIEDDLIENDQLIEKLLEQEKYVGPREREEGMRGTSGTGIEPYTNLDSAKRALKNIKDKYTDNSMEAKLRTKSDGTYTIIIKSIVKNGKVKSKVEKVLTQSLNTKEKIKSKPAKISKKELDPRSAPVSIINIPKNEFLENLGNNLLSDLCKKLNKEFSHLLFWNKTSSQTKTGYETKISVHPLNRASRPKNEELKPFLLKYSNFQKDIDGEKIAIFNDGSLAIRGTGSAPPKELIPAFIKAGKTKQSLARLELGEQKFEKSDITVLQEYFLGKIIKQGVKIALNDSYISEKGDITDEQKCIEEFNKILDRDNPKKIEMNNKYPVNVGRISSFIDSWIESFDSIDDNRKIFNSLTTLYKDGALKLEDYFLIHPSYIDGITYNQLEKSFSREDIDKLKNVLEKVTLITSNNKRIDRDSILPADIFFVAKDHIGEVIEFGKSVKSGTSAEKYIQNSNNLFLNKKYIPISLKKNDYNTYDISIIKGNFYIAGDNKNKQYFNTDDLKKFVYFEIGLKSTFIENYSISDQPSGAILTLRTSDDGYISTHLKSMNLLFKRKSEDEAQQMEAMPGTDSLTGAKIGRFSNGLKDELSSINKLKDFYSILYTNNLLGSRSKNDFENYNLFNFSENDNLLITEIAEKLEDKDISNREILDEYGEDLIKFQNIFKNSSYTGTSPNEKIKNYAKLLQRLGENTFYKIYYLNKLNEIQTARGSKSSLFRDELINFLSNLKNKFEGTQLAKPKNVKQNLIFNLTCLLSRAAKYPLSVVDEKGSNLITKIADHIKIS